MPKEEPSDDVVQDLLTEFGPTLVELGHHAWMIQANALSKTSYAGRKVDGKPERNLRLDDLNEKSSVEIQVETVAVGLNRLMGRNN